MQLKALITLLKMFPRLYEDTLYTANNEPEMISSRIYELIGINIEELTESDDVEQMVWLNIDRCRYGPPAM